MNPRPDFGVYLRQLRTARDLTQEALAEAVACASQTVRSFESGRRRPSRDMAARLASVLQVSPAERDTFLRLARAPLAPPNAPTSPATDQDTAPLAPAPHHQPVPQPVDELIGRHHDLDRLRHALVGDQQRLVTLLGPGGVGKTRLALQAAANLSDHFADHAAFVALASVSNVAGLIAATATAVGCLLSSMLDPAVALVTFLRERELLLVLDNLEHLLGEAQGDAVADFLTLLLRETSHIHMLVTSRERLRLQAEWVVEIGGLGLPTDHQPTSIARSDAVLLFVERARRVTGDFVLNSENQLIVGQICQRLDGLPLALELAAAQVSFLSTTALLERLDQALPLLEGGARDLPARQRTMRATINWSHDLLSKHERRVFQRLGVLVGSFSLSAAEAVAAGEGVEPAQVVGLLRRLVDRSLVVREDVVGEEVRYRLLEPVRQYAVERLEAEPSELFGAHQRHAIFFHYLAEQLGPQLRIPQDEAAFAHLLSRIDQEYPNIRAAVVWALAHGKPEIGARIGAALFTFWWYRDQQEEPRGWMEAVVADRERLAPHLYAHAIIALGTAQYRVAPAQWLSTAQEALALFEQDGDLVCQAQALMMIGLTHLQLGDLAGAEAGLQRANELSRRVSDIWLMNITGSWFGSVLGYKGQYARAAVYLDESLVRANAQQDTWNVLLASLGSALLAHAQGDVQRGALFCRTMLGYAARNMVVANNSAVAYSLECLATAAALQGESLRATRLFGAAEALWEIGGKFPMPAQPVYTQARVAISSQLVVAAVSATWREGRMMGLTKVIDYALEPATSD